jgi:hypothetical protein
MSAPINIKNGCLHIKGSPVMCSASKRDTSKDREPYNAIFDPKNECLSPKNAIILAIVLCIQHVNLVRPLKERASSVIETIN